VASKLDFPQEVKPATAPQPKPSLAARPKTLSVTQVETLMRNPYAIYASQVLKLRPLKPIMRELDGSDFGSVVHKALEMFIKENQEWPEQPLEILQECGRRALRNVLQNERVGALWWPRFVKISEFVIQHETVRREQIKHIFQEVEGSKAFGDFTLTGRADRIEEYKDGEIRIIDYKTGSLPKDTDIERGLASQLVLLGLLEYKGLSIKPQSLSLEYWHLHGRKESGNLRLLPQPDIAHYAKAALQGLADTLKKYSNPAMPYRVTPVPAYAGEYDDYEHLARVKEWY
jgi:ATP-dependent helicase/nuclease subunit B